jgi:hypothetical protein
MLEIIKVADEYKLPILADEVYYGLVFGENSEYHSFGNLTSDVPVIVKPQITHLLFRLAVPYQSFIAFQGGELVG